MITRFLLLANDKHLFSFIISLTLVWILLFSAFIPTDRVRELIKILTSLLASCLLMIGVWFTVAFSYLIKLLWRVGGFTLSILVINFQMIMLRMAGWH